jgi:hypothetical protein
VQCHLLMAVQYHQWGTEARSIRLLKNSLPRRGGV